MKYFILPLSFFLIVLSSCTTMNKAQIASAATDVTSSLVSKDSESLIGESGTPFLFETEILPAPAQLSALWEGLTDSGYDFSSRGDISILDTDDNTWQRFSSSREVELWFERYAEGKAALAVVPTGKGRLLLIFDKDRRNIHPLRGLKVEEE